MTNPNAQEYYNKASLGYNKKWENINNPLTPSQFYRKRLNDEVLLTSDVKSGEKTIEIGCGTGLVLSELIKRTNHVFGTDISIGMLNRAKENLSKNASVKITNGFNQVESLIDGEILLWVDDYRNLNLPANYFDKIFSIEVLRYIDDIDICFKKMRSIMAPEAKFIFTITNRWSFSLFPIKYLVRKIFGLVKKDELQQYFVTEKTLKQKLSRAGLEIVEFKKYGLLTANPFARKFINSHQRFEKVCQFDSVLSKIFLLNKFFDTFIVMVKTS